MSIKYYHLAKDETTPEEFCAIRDVGGKPREYTFYVLDAENAKLREQLEYDRQTSRSRLERIYQLKAENAKLRELVRDYAAFLALADLAQPIGYIIAARGKPTLSKDNLAERARELGIEVPE